MKKSDWVGQFLLQIRFKLIIIFEVKGLLLFINLGANYVF